MDKRTFSSLGRIGAIEQLYEGTTFKAFTEGTFESSSKEHITTSSVLFQEGTDFDLVYFPLKHLGYKCVVAVSGELYASLAHPQTLDIRLGISSKLDFPQIKELFDGMATAAREHGYKSIGLDLFPSKNGLCIAISATGRISDLTRKRRPAPKSMDLVCVSGNLGAAFLGLQLLEREKRKFTASGEDSSRKSLESYKLLVGAYLKPSLEPSVVHFLEETEIIPSSGCFITRGLADAVKRIARSSALGVKIYVDKIPFAGRTFDLGKEFDIDPVSAAMNGGEDYRLLFTVPINRAEDFRRDFQTFDIIGHLAHSDVGTVLVTPDGLEHPITAQGW